MFKINQEVTVRIGQCRGIIADISTWGKILKIDNRDQRPAYFVRVKEWDNGTNGGRWFHE